MEVAQWGQHSCLLRLPHVALILHDSLHVHRLQKMGGVRGVDRSDRLRLRGRRLRRFLCIGRIRDSVRLVWWSRRSRLEGLDRSRGNGGLQRLDLRNALLELLLLLLSF